MTMTDPEQVEKVRQGIMRFRELLNILRLRLEAGEAAYARLFAGYPPEVVNGMPEKALQGLLARDIVQDTSALRKAILQARFDARDLERAFEELHDNLVPD